jgi:hypothetical protein
MVMRPFYNISISDGIYIFTKHNEVPETLLETFNLQKLKEE